MNTSGCAVVRAAPLASVLAMVACIASVTRLDSEAARNYQTGFKRSYALPAAGAISSTLLRGVPTHCGRSGMATMANEAQNG